MKKFLIAFLSAIMLMTSVPAYAYEYKFESGADTRSTFGDSTTSDEPVAPNPETLNIRRNKDAAYFPPAYGIFSGSIPTEPTSLYHDNSSPASAAASAPVSSSGGSFSGMAASNYAGDTNWPDSMLPSTSVTEIGAETLNTTPWAYEDGSIGSLYIHKIDKTIKVYEGESLENMKKGIGHFEMTSAWDGNCAFAGHNRGAAAYFSFVKDLQIGDKITYTTNYGVRTYEIFSKEKISETDYSSLAWSGENLLTLITCVEDEAELRWSVSAREIKNN